MNDIYENRLSAAPRASEIFHGSSWGFAGLHPRLYAIARYRGLDRLLLSIFHVLPNVGAGAVKIGEAIHSRQFT